MRSASEIWAAALGELQLQISKANFDTWLKDTKGLSLTDELFVIGVPNAFVGEWLNERLRPLIARTLSGILGRNIGIEFKTVPVAPPRTLATPAVTYNDGGVCTLERPVALTAHPRLNPRYTFENFVPGDSNRLSYSSALEFAESPSVQYNPLYIYGATGLGKTHLLQAIAHVTSKRMSTVYMTAEHFTNQFVAAVRGRQIDDFRARFRTVEAFIIDDIQFISGREQTQECMLHVFIELYNNNCRIVIAGDRPPQAIPSLDERLQSRFSCGLVTRILPPDKETRLAILQMLVNKRGLTITKEVLEVIASCTTGNIRELEGIFNQVIARAKLAGSEPDLTIAGKVLSEMSNQTNGQGTLTFSSPNAIVEAVARSFGVPAQALVSARRDKRTTLARQVAMYLMHEVAGYKIADVGRALGNRDHSTIIHGLNRITAKIGSDGDLKRTVEAITRDIFSGAGFPPGNGAPDSSA